MDRFDRNYYLKSPDTPRSQWKATNPNSMVGIDLKPAPIPDDACLECDGKGSRWELKRKGKGFAQAFRKCPDCNGTGRLGDPQAIKYLPGNVPAGSSE